MRSVAYFFVVNLGPPALGDFSTQGKKWNQLPETVLPERCNLGMFTYELVGVRKWRQCTCDKVNKQIIKKTLFESCAKLIKFI